MTNKFDSIINIWPRLLIFLPNTNELQRFVLSGAFDDLAKDHELHYVVPPADLAKMRAAAPQVLTVDNTHELSVSPDRYAIWAKLFEATCVRYAKLSPSFYIRASSSLTHWQTRILRISLRALGLGVGGFVRGTEWLPIVPQDVRTKAKLVRGRLAAAESRFGQYRYLNPGDYESLVEHALADLSPLPEIVELFDRLHPLYVLIPSSLLDLFCNDVLWACEVEGMTAVVLQSGWDNLSSKGIIHHKPSYMACWGPQSVRHAKYIQAVCPGTPRAVGAPHYEFLQPASADDIAQFRDELGVAPGDTLLLFGGSFRQFDETALLLRLECLAESGTFGRLKVLYRPHPWRVDRDDEDDFFQYTWKHVIFDPDMRERYVRARQERGYLKREVPMYDMAYLARVLSAVDAVISPMSTLLLEALIMKKPTMAISFSDGKHAHNPSVTSKMTHFSEMRKSRALIWSDVNSRFEKDCAALLDKSFQYHSAGNRAALLQDIIKTEPGTYASRLADYCATEIEPQARKMRANRAMRKRITISHAYGAHLIAQDYCGTRSSRSIIPGYWMHGWIPPYHNVNPALVALHKTPDQHHGFNYEAQIKREKLDTWQWVSRTDQADYLISHGYKRVKAIGLPIVYLPIPNVRRVSHSLLVMPPHSHRTHGPNDPLAENYADAIADLRLRFEHIWVCLHEDDIANREWIESFRKRGIKILPSIDQSGATTLDRLSRLLHSFEYVTTNGYGSHIAYAAFCGARVSVYGPFADFPRHRITRSHAVKMFPKLVDIGYGLCTEKALRQHYPDLFVEPHKAVERTEWGAEEVGATRRVEPAELARLFGWADEPQAQAVTELS